MKKYDSFCVITNLTEDGIELDDTIREVPTGKYVKLADVIGMLNGISAKREAMRRIGGERVVSGIPCSVIEDAIKSTAGGQ